MTRRFLRYLPAILFFCSLLLPAFAIGDAAVIGLGALIYGWVGIGRSFGWSWLANPLLIFTLLLFFHRSKSIWRRTALYTASAAFLFSLSFLLIDKIPGKKSEAMVGAVTLKVGYWIWLYSMAALLVAAVLNNSEGPGKFRPAD
ncbi:hypothetical protein Q4E93_18715 [Flavitalea sp. BT771]|uniref:hypothetical protein n=1 Tax=Flavitalea sp. BT771 TaxID=3063329 RepID=UPI0026E23EF0|nr:hypothetical protein [Flavitalea sp. BT771]MDO6432645.1 hypothetical protein [Flavitalea sp. BT771]MDV6222079.1 hypothetical protein [Flavitalea sp. BT771]